MSPGTLGAYQWDSNGRTIKELILTSTYAKEHSITSMHLNLLEFSAINEPGDEITVHDFPGQKAVDFTSLSCGSFLRSRNIVKLEQGKYKTLRFYIAGEDSYFTTCKREQRDMSDVNFLDFEVDGGFYITGEESPEFILRFDFPPYEPGRVSKGLGKAVLFPFRLGWQLSQKLQQSFGT